MIYNYTSVCIYIIRVIRVLFTGNMIPENYNASAPGSK